MAGQLNISGFDKEIKGLTNDLKELSNVLTNLILETQQLNESFKKGAETQKQTAENTRKAADNANVLTTAQREQQKIEKQLQDIQAKQIALSTERAKELEREKIKLSEKRKEINENVKAEQAEANSIDKLRQKNKELTKERNSLSTTTERGRKRIQEINTELNKNNKIIKENVDQLTKQKIEVGNYKENIKGALRESGLFSTQIAQLEKVQRTMTTAVKGTTLATSGWTAALKILKVALISTGIGALIVALGSLAAFFTKTQRGADKLSIFLKQLGSVISVIVDRLSQIGEAFTLFATGRFRDGFKQIGNAFKGIGDEIEREWKLTKELNKATQDLRDEEIEFIKTRALLNKQISELRFKAKDENITTAERLKLLRQAINVEEELLDKEVLFAKERARIARENLDLSESSAEEIRAVAELEAEAIEIETQSLDRRRTIQSEILGLERRYQKEISKTNEYEAKLNAKLQKEKLQNTEDYNKYVEDLLEEELKITEDAANEALDNFLYTEEQKRLAAEETTNKILEEAEKRKEAEGQLLNETTNLINQGFEYQKTLTENEIANLEQKKERKLISEQEYNRGVASLRRKQAEADKQQAIYNAIISTSVGVAKALELGPLGILLAGIITAKGLAEIATISKQPIPKFKKGTDGPLGKDTMAIINEERPEVVRTKDGQFYFPEGRNLPVILPKGSEVLPSVNEAVNKYGGIDNAKLNELISETRATRMAIAGRPVQQTTITDRGLEVAYITKQQRINYIDKYMRK